MDNPPRVWIILEEANPIRMKAGPFSLSALEIGGGRVLFPAAADFPAPATDQPPAEAAGAAPGATSAPAGRRPPGSIPLLDRVRLHLPPVKSYADAQLDDTQNLPRARLRWRPPLRFSVRARTSLPAPLGTFGFGFWNDPFSLSVGMGGAARKFPSAPQCAWFFYGSPPHDLPLAEGVPGFGWKAATIRFRNIPALVLAPAALGGVLLAGLPPVRSRAFGWARRFYHAEERLLPIDPSQWHAYAIEWRAASVGFFVDGVEVLRSRYSPLPPLGLVLWIDNQYAVASAAKGFGFGLLPLEREQALELEAARIETGIPA
jgi:hypothetical protein